MSLLVGVSHPNVQLFEVYVLLILDRDEYIEADTLGGSLVFWTTGVFFYTLGDLMVELIILC